MPDNPDLFRVKDEKDDHGRSSSALRRWGLDITIALIIVLLVWLIASALLTPSCGQEWTYDQFMARL